MTPLLRLKVRVNSTVNTGGSPARRPANATVLLAICAVLAAGGAIAAEIAHRHNAERGAKYAADPSCHASLFPGQSSPASTGLCTIESATVSAQYVHYYRGSRYYRLALRTSDGVIDSIELKGTNNKTIWNTVRFGSAVSVQRFMDEGPGRHHVTLVAANGLEANTEWNPAWQNTNTEFGVWFLGILAVVFVGALIWVRVRRLASIARPLSLALLAVSSLATPIRAQSRPLPTPGSVLGYEPGADRRLPAWKQITDYFTALGKASPRVQTRVLGKTVLGRPFLAVFIAEASTLGRLEHYRGIQRKLMDPRLRTAAERAKLIDEGKNVILITSSIHSTEVGGFTTPLVIADRLARGDTPEAKEILANTIVIIVPSQNPDGVDIVGDWYRSTLDKGRGGESAGVVPSLHGARQ